jgi:hypothetical protein
MMEKRSRRSFQIKWYVLVMFLVLVAVLLALNVFQYSEYVSLSSKFLPVTPVLDERIDGGMGVFQAAVISPFGDLRVGAGSNFNVSVLIILWTPYAAGTLFNFSFRLYGCPAHSEYSAAPMTERNVTIQKDKDALNVGASVIFTETAPTIEGVYIFKIGVVVNDISYYQYEAEFPILAI